MTRDLIDKDFGIPMSEWISRIPNNLEYDIVGLWEIIPTGRERFDLAGDDLVDFVRRCFVGVLDHGGKFKCGLNDHPNWKSIEDFSGTSAEIASRLVDAWTRSETEPDWYELWFESNKVD